MRIDLRLPFLIGSVLFVAPDAFHSASADEPQFSAQQIEFFESRVRPLLAEHCAKCHNPTDRKGNLVLDSRANLLAGGDTGPAVVPGEPDASQLILAVRYGADGYQMPPDGKLDAAAIATLEEWVAMGAPWPGRSAAAATAGEFDLEERARRWSFQPLQASAPPPVRDSDWPRTPVDRFLLSRLEDAGLRPASPADLATWMRRIYLDTLGLPPTPGEVAEFTADTAPDAEARLVERLLASPRFGERWARHWLDLMRYAESRGHEFDFDIANPWHYRDYVIRALNDDVPYDRFVVEHIAGDLLPRSGDSAATFEARTDPLTGANESVTATGFWYLGEWVHSPVDIRQEEADRFANMIDVYSKAFLGLTVACARCHDHKFDPITQRDFYALQGYLQSSVYRQALFESMDHNRRIARELEELRAEASAVLLPVLEELLAEAKRPTAVSVETPAEADVSAATFDVVVDYSQPGATLFAEGGLFGTRAVAPGEVRLSEDPERPVASVATEYAVERMPGWPDVGPAPDAMDEPGRLNGWKRAGRTLRTPGFVIKRPKLFALIDGGCNTYVTVDSHVLNNGPLHGALLKEHPSQPGWRWIEHDVSRYVGHRAHVEFVLRGDEPFRIRAVIQADEPPNVVRLPPVDGALPGGLQPSRLGLLAALASDPGALGLSPEVVQSQLAERARPFIERRRALLSQVRRHSAAAPAIADANGEDEYVFIRGQWKKQGETVPRRFLEVFGGTEAPRPEMHAAGSGRLELALQMIDPERTPILPRVIVNRIWQHYFGRGLVATPDDFGHMGQDPSHPELLDWLARELVQHGWSLKHIHRLILQSAAYRMASRSDTADERRAEEADPENVLLHRMPIRRLEGEIVRDQILYVSGRLDDRLYGRSVPLHLTPFMEGRGRPAESGPLDGAGRRSVYLAVRRNFPDPFLQAFDMPTPHTTIGRRSVSNVPAQALALMNNPFVVQQARLWAERLLAAMPGSTPRERIDRLYRMAFSRVPTAEELADGEAFIARQSREYQVGPDDVSVWADYCHVLMNVKEFIFVR